MATASGLHKLLPTKLQGLGLTKSQVSGLADYLGSLGKAGFDPGDVFPVGIPIPDHVGIEVNFTPDQIELIKKLLEDPRIREIRIFPKGIPVPNRFQATITRQR